MNKIKIGCLTYDVLDWDKKEAEESRCYGMHSSRLQRIKVDSSASKERKKEVFLHEVLHAVWNQWIPSDEKSDEEKIVSQLAMGLTTVFKDNPELKKVLF